MKRGGPGPVDKWPKDGPVALCLRIQITRTMDRVTHFQKTLSRAELHYGEEIVKFAIEKLYADLRHVLPALDREWVSIELHHMWRYDDEEDLGDN